MGLRELKKERVRKVIAEVAAELFRRRGYAEVTMAEVAAAAQVSVSTLFNYYPTKPSLVFDLEDAIEGEMRAALRGRTRTILVALESYFLGSQLFNPPEDEGLVGFGKLIRSSPELTNHLRSLWGRYEATLAAVIRKETGAGKIEAECVAKLVFEGVSAACNAPRPKESLRVLFKILRKGWDR